MLTLQKVDDSFVVDQDTYTPILTFIDSRGCKTQVVHFGTTYKVAGQDRPYGAYRFLDEIDARVLQTLQGLPDPIDALDVSPWLLRIRCNLVRFTRADNGVRPLFAAYCSILYQLSTYSSENHEVTVLRKLLDLIWPSLDEIERTQSQNLSSILWVDLRKSTSKPS